MSCLYFLRRHNVTMAATPVNSPPMLLTDATMRVTKTAVFTHGYLSRGGGCTCRRVSHVVFDGQDDSTEDTQRRGNGDR